MSIKIKTIIFDLGGVLYDLDRDRCVRSLVQLGLTDANNLLSNYKQSGVFQQLEDGSIEPDLFYDSIREITGNHVTNEAIKGAWNSFLVQIPDYKLEMVLDLRKKFNIFMLSNTNAIHFADEIPNAFTKYGKTIDDYFDKCYLSFQMNTSKPNPQIFELLITDSGIDPREALFIDDSPENIRIANELGFQTYLATPLEDFRSIFEGL